MYNLDTEAAKQADQKGGIVNEAGKYIGAFTRAENVTSKKGTKGVEFSFKTQEGLNADYLTLWTKNAEGKELYGFKVLMAIMTCLKVKNITPVSRAVEKYDQETGGKKNVQVEVFADLMNKPIGLLINMEEYEKNAGGTAWKPTIYAPFEASTGFTASEILNKAMKPEVMEKMLLTMSNRPLKKQTATAQQTNDFYQQAAQSSDDFDDQDIPF